MLCYVFGYGHGSNIYKKTEKQYCNVFDKKSCCVQ